MKIMKDLLFFSFSWSTFGFRLLPKVVKTTEKNVHKFGSLGINRMQYDTPNLPSFVIVIVIVITILFTKLPWPGDSEVTFRSSSQAATCPPVYHTRRRLHTIPLIAERQAGKL